MATIELRPYQAEMHQGILGAVDQGHRSIMAQLATGGGKSLLFRQLTQEAAQKGEKALIIVHRKELLNQAIRHVKSTGITPGIIQGSNKFMADFPVQVASIQTFHNRLNLPYKPDWILFDEAHHMVAKTWRKVLNHYPDAVKVGFTATPCTTSGEGFEELFETMIRGISVSELMSQGWLCPYKIFGANPIDVSAVKTQAGDFQAKGLEEAADRPHLVADLVQTWVKHAFGKKTITFCVSPQHSKNTVDAYNEIGRQYWGRDIAVHLDGTMSDAERDKVNAAFAHPFNPALPMFEGGGALILSNFGIVTEGYDVPDAEVVQMARPTQSLSLFLQMIGRVLRPSPGKLYAIILDHAGNIMRHGRPDAKHEWALEGVKKVESMDIQCPHCFTIQEKLKVRPMLCAECGHEIIPLHPAKVTVPRGERSPIAHITEVQLEDLSKYSDNIMDLMVAVSKAKEKYKRPDGSYPKKQAVTSFLKRCHKILVAELSKPKGARAPNQVFDDLKQAEKILSFGKNWALHQYRELLQAAEKDISSSSS